MASKQPLTHHDNLHYNDHESYNDLVRLLRKEPHRPLREVAPTQQQYAHMGPKNQRFYDLLSQLRTDHGYRRFRVVGEFNVLHPNSGYAIVRLLTVTVASVFRSTQPSPHKLLLHFYDTPMQTSRSMLVDPELFGAFLYHGINYADRRAAFFADHPVTAELMQEYVVTETEEFVHGLLNQMKHSLAEPNE
jgi:hypothetical protein